MMVDRVYVMTHPVRAVPVEVDDSEFEGLMKARTRSHLSVIVAPGCLTGPLAVHVPVSGHNLVLEFAGQVLVERIGIAQVNTSPLDADGFSAMTRGDSFVLTPDFVEEVVRSKAAYTPLAAPDVEVDLDHGAVRAVDGATVALPLQVMAGECVSLVIAPVTGVRQLVTWTLTVEASRAGRRARFTVDLLTTAVTSRANTRSGQRALIQDLYPDHWYRGASRDDMVPKVGQDAAVISVLAHMTEGGGFVHLPALDVEPEPVEAAQFCRQATLYAAQGDMGSAHIAYLKAAEAGSAAAAHWLGCAAETNGDLESAVKWLTVAARRPYRLACNDLAAVYCRLGRFDDAEHWYRRAVDVGDWVALGGLGTVLLQRGAPEAEGVLRMAASNLARKAAAMPGDEAFAAHLLSAAATASQTLATWLLGRGRTDEAVEMLKEASRQGNSHAGYTLGAFYQGRGDLPAAARWWRESAEAGFPLSAYKLGQLDAYLGDSAEAEQWWRHACEVLPTTLASGVSAPSTRQGRDILIGDLAESGEALAAYALGIRLRYRGEAEGEHWLRLAARAGHRAARYELSEEPDWTGAAETFLLEPRTRVVLQEGWLVLPDPGWSSGAPVPIEAQVGCYELGENGDLGVFQPNPRYVPASRTLPTDPVHALARLTLADSSVGARLPAAVARSILEIACDASDHLQFMRAPDGAPYVAVVTAELHKRRLPAARWHQVVGSRLRAVVPVGIQVMVNPGDAAQFKLLAALLCG